VLGAVLVGPGALASGPPSARVRVGGAPILAAGDHAIGGLAPDRPMHITVVLEPRDPEALDRFATTVSDPASPEYRDYLTPTQFGARFGATPAQLAAVTRSLRAHGLRPGAVPADRLSVPVTATVGLVERAFDIRLERVALIRSGEATVANAAPAVDGQIAADVQSVVGLSSLGAPRPLLARSARARLAPRARAHVQTGGPQPCGSASSTATQNGAYTADQIASAYGFPGLYAAGDQGQGQTIAEYELEPDDPNDIAAYQSCYGTHASISYVQVDGGAGTGAGGGEDALDIENAVGLAPKANYIVYQAQNSNQSAPGSGPYDLFAAIINQDRANVVSVSWGQCETLEGTGGAAAERTLFEQAAAQGQSIVSAAGDEGSEDCNNANNIPNPALAVDDPSSQPFVTGVGGTSMSQLGPPPSQTVWNNGGNVTGLLGIQPGAGGGGVSSIWGMPGYQSGAPGTLHVINSNSSRSPCGASSGYCREVPDVSADADPGTGYVIYYNGSASNPTASTGWQAVGGTSGAAPVWAALLALADASSACHGSPVGFADPALYKAAASAYTSDFSDITGGNNDFTGTNGGQFPAGSGYDMASGLGTPNASPLAQTLCADTLRLRDPGAQRTALGRPVNLQMVPTGSVSGPTTYVAHGLPAGLTISGSSGKITGRPRTIGTFTVAVVVLDSSLAVRGIAFTWTVQGNPTVSRAALTGVRAGHPRLTLTLLAGQLAPGLKSLRIALPGTLRFTRARAAITGPDGQRVPFRAQLVSGQLVITLTRAPQQLTLKVGFPTLQATSQRARRARAFRVRVTATDTGRLSSGLAVTAHARS
jgi:subtilase family serine protease